jgi:hypothetical protein
MIETNGAIFNSYPDGRTARRRLIGRQAMLVVKSWRFSSRSRRAMVSG